MGEVVYLSRTAIRSKPLPTTNPEIEKSRLRRRALKSAAAFFVLYLSAIAICVYLRSVFGLEHPVLSMVALLAVIISVFWAGFPRVVELADQAMAEPYS
jgi:Trk-type K+ transport system membrane component